MRKKKEKAINIRSFYLILSILSMGLGCLMYAKYRTTRLVFVDWIECLGYKEEYILFIKCLQKDNLKKMPDWFIYSFPDGLWVFSYVCFMIFIWKGKINSKNIIWIIALPIYAIISELAQLFDVYPGTFDAKDLLFYAIGAIIPLLTLFKLQQ